jgi:hypothetical protein
VDWNNDGRKDLLTGENSGNIRIFLNTGTDANPAFSGYQYLQMGGSNFDVGYYSTVHVCDWNSDGKKDVLVGENYGNVYLLLNVGTDASPVFNSSVPLKNGSGNLNAYSRSSPTTCDWNRDGKKDLLVGNYDGRVYYFENQGTDEDPVFNGYTFLQAGGKTLDVHYYSRIDVADWDNDGVMDLISGNRYYDGMPNGGVWFFNAQGPLAIDTTTLSHSMGGTVDFRLDAGMDHAGKGYILLGSVTGTDPGTVLPGGGILPLNFDAFLLYSYRNPGGSLFTGFQGFLDASGEAAATASKLATLPFATGKILNFAYTTVGPFDYQSNAVEIEIVP